MVIAKLGKKLRQQLKEKLTGAAKDLSSETLPLVVTAIAIGTVVALAAVGFDMLFHYVDGVIAQLRQQVGRIKADVLLIFIPALGGLLVSPVVVYWARDVKGSGIPTVMLAVSHFGGRVSRRVMFWRPIATTLSIGTGASLGTEGPIIHMGASLASSFSDIFSLNDERRRSLVAVATASGMAATFNAPIAGVLFALEEILGRSGNRHLAPVVIGAVSAAVVSRSFLGDDPAFFIPRYQFESVSHIPLYILLAIVGAIVSVLFIRMIVWGDDLFNAIRIPLWLRPPLGGLMLGCIALVIPEVLGRGFETTELLLSGEMTALSFLLFLGLGKMVATSISMGSWGAGGIFAPMLMIGAATGAALAEVAAYFSPIEQTGMFALVGMAAMFSGTMRSPMATLVMIFEMSDGYGMILPLLLSAVVATLVADLLHPQSIYRVLLSRKGFSLLRLRDDDILQTVRVKEVMDKDIPFIDSSSSLKSLKIALSESHHHGFLLQTRDEPGYIRGIVTLSDLERARREGLSQDALVSEIAQRTVHCARADETISEVLERMANHDIARMPVVARQDGRKAIGFVRQSDLAKAYYQAIRRQRQLEKNREETRLRDLTGQEIVELRVRKNSPIAGLTLKEAQLPKESIVVAIRKGGKTIFPHGDTKLEVGDMVVGNVAPGFSQQFKSFFTEPKP